MANHRSKSDAPKAPLGLQLLGKIMGRPSSRSRPSGLVAEDVPDPSAVRGHALFVRFLERKGLAHCVCYFSNDMTLGRLRSLSPRELLKAHGVKNAIDRDLIMRLVEESHRDVPPDVEVSGHLLYHTDVSSICSNTNNTLVPTTNVFI